MTTLNFSLNVWFTIQPCKLPCVLCSCQILRSVRILTAILWFLKKYYTDFKPSCRRCLNLTIASEEKIVMSFIEVFKYMSIHNTDGKLSLLSFNLGFNIILQVLSPLRPVKIRTNLLLVFACHPGWNDWWWYRLFYVQQTEYIMSCQCR